MTLIEDMNNGDITTDNLIDASSVSEAEIMAKEDGVICGLELAERIFTFLDGAVKFNRLRKDGDSVKKGDIIAKIQGSTRTILTGERTALNFMQRLSGIATMASRYSERAKGYKARVVDTRKTTPGLRALEKYAVKTGGAYNHRFNLSDAVMIKDNHIKAAGGIKEAVEQIRVKIPHTVKIEVEVEDLEGLQEALDVNTDIIMLDNMSDEEMKEAVEINNGKAILEASGNITLERVESVAQTGVDVISVGALTHSVKALDISLNIL
ncbi:MAG: carboxylating nicotinate-nucleotide diphosphorylase [Firmicutes bacterium]|nr:carboxylating nicotinate-nucleotide diphosphorylase [Bacillota bacterium]